MTEFLCLDCENVFSLREGANAPLQCSVRHCRSYEVISESQLEKIVQLTQHYIDNTLFGIFPFMDAFSSVFSQIGLRRYRPENTMKLMRIVVDRIEGKTKGKPSESGISVVDLGEKHAGDR